MMNFESTSKDATPVAGRPNFYIWASTAAGGFGAAWATSIALEANT